MRGPTEAEIEVDPGERRLNELGYKQELRREMVLFLNFLYQLCNALNFFTRNVLEFLCRPCEDPFPCHQYFILLHCFHWFELKRFVRHVFNND